VDVVPASPGFVPRLLGFILAIVGVSLGVPFLLIGLVGTAADADAFVVVGAAALTVGVVLAAVTVTARGHARRRVDTELAARTGRGSAIVVEAKLQTHSRIGARHPLRLRVRLGGEERERTFWALPYGLPRVGDAIEVAYDPGDPGNFAPYTNSGRARTSRGSTAIGRSVG
jgi:hypothetical protein